MGQKIFQVFMALMGAILALLFVALLGKLVWQEYTGERYSRYNYVDAVQTDTVSSCLTVNTVFESVEDVLETHSSAIAEHQYLTTFKDIPPSTVELIAHVLLKDRPYITIADIVNEYNNLDTDDSIAKIGDPDPVAETTASDEKLLDKIVDSILVDSYGKLSYRNYVSRRRGIRIRIDAHH